MKILTALIFLALASPICFNFAASYVNYFENFIYQGKKPAIYVIPSEFFQEPGILILVGFGLLLVAEIGRKIISKRNIHTRTVEN